MKKSEIIFIIDQSGSMDCVTTDTIGTYNSLLAAHKGTDEKITVTLVLFNDEVKTLYSRIPICEAPELTPQTYIPCGTTALCDAACLTLTDELLYQLSADAAEKPEKTLVFIITDGLENASRKYETDDMRKLITATKNYGWQYAFYGANFDTEKVGKSYGLAKDDITEFKQTSDGMSRFKVACFEELSDFLETDDCF